MRNAIDRIIQAIETKNYEFILQELAIILQISSGKSPAFKESITDSIMNLTTALFYKETFSLMPPEIQGQLIDLMHKIVSLYPMQLISDGKEITNDDLFNNLKQIINPFAMHI